MLNACTIIARNYLPFARVLVDSFFAHHPSGLFTVLLIDDESRQFAPDEARVRWWRLSDLGLDPGEVRKLAAIYDVTELATAVKPLLLKRLIDETQREAVYFDPDICIYEALDEVPRLAAVHGIVLTPHTTAPFPNDGRRVDALHVLGAGLYNLGFIAVGPGADSFLTWWWQRTRRQALNDVSRNMFTDQRWVDYVPCFYEHYILKDPACNVAYWNLHARELTVQDDRYYVDGGPLRFFHFSGFDVRKPHLLSKFQEEAPRILLSENPALTSICRDYASRLIDAGASQPQPSYGWGTLVSGLRLNQRMRRVYWKGVVDAEKGVGVEPPNPFDAVGPEPFLTWLNSPRENSSPKVSRYVHSIHDERVDLQIQFPNLYGYDATRFAHWLWHDNDLQEAIPTELMPHLAADSAPAAERQHPELAAGVTIVGYLRAELGIGQAARLLVEAIGVAGVPFATRNYDRTLNRQSHPFSAHGAGRAFNVNVLCINADSTNQFAREAGREFFIGRHTVGYWFWEIEHFPPDLDRAFDVVDEVWTATEFVAKAIRSRGRRQVFTIPLPVPMPQRSPELTRERLGLPNRFTFLFVFDFLSVVERKNPVGLIRAFARAFAPNEGPVLVIKTINGHLRLPDLELVRAAAAGRPDILVIDGYYSATERDALLHLSDCYVSLHRSEGLGLTMGEAMACGKPVIATGYSGNLHFMTPENSYLVDYVLTAVPEGCSPYPAGALWADPDLEHSARLMREVYERPDLAQAKARRGQSDILDRHNTKVAAAAVGERLRDIHAFMHNRLVNAVVPGEEDDSKASVPASPEPSLIAPLESMLPYLEQIEAPQVGAEGRNLSRLRVAAQRWLFRAIRPYSFQQSHFHKYLIIGFRQVVSAFRREQLRRSALEARVRDLANELVETKRELRSLQRQVSRTTADEVRSTTPNDIH